MQHEHNGDPERRRPPGPAGVSVEWHCDLNLRSPVTAARLTAVLTVEPRQTRYLIWPMFY